VSVLSEAARGLRRNLPAVAVYVLITGGTTAIRRVCDLLVAGGIFFTLEPSPLRAYRFAMDLFVALGHTAASVMAFSRMGRELDRPLWKVADDREAFKRFFTLWFLILLSFLTVIRLFERVAETAPDSGWISLLKFLYFSMFLFSIPVGACIMFSGHLLWSELPQDLAPLVYQLPKTVAVVFVNFLMFVGHLALIDFLVDRPELRSALWFLALIDVPFALVDCFVFAGIWLICMVHRKEMEERDRNIDFNF